MIRLESIAKCLVEYMLSVCGVKPQDQKLKLIKLTYLAGTKILMAKKNC